MYSNSPTRRYIPIIGIPKAGIYSHKAGFYTRGWQSGEIMEFEK